MCGFECIYPALAKDTTAFDGEPRNPGMADLRARGVLTSLGNPRSFRALFKMPLVENQGIDVLCVDVLKPARGLAVSRARHHDRRIARDVPPPQCYAARRMGSGRERS